MDAGPDRERGGDARPGGRAAADESVFFPAGFAGADPLAPAGGSAEVDAGAAEGPGFVSDVLADAGGADAAGGGAGASAGDRAGTEREIRDDVQGGGGTGTSGIGIIFKETLKFFQEELYGGPGAEM